MGDNALLRMVDVLGRLDGRQPEPDRYAAGVACLEALLGSPADDVAAALARVRQVEPRLAALLDPMMGVTIVPTMIRASEKENVIPSRCTVRVDCRVPPGMGEDHVRHRVDGTARRRGRRRLRASSSANRSSATARRPTRDSRRCLRDFVERTEPGAEMLPIVLPGFTDSHWFRKAFPECVAYGFFPQRAMTRYDTMPLIHAPDERIRVEDIDLASRFFSELAPAALG